MNDKIKTRIATSLAEALSNWIERERKSGNLLDDNLYIDEDTEYYMTQAALNVLWSTIEIQKFIDENN